MIFNDQYAGYVISAYVATFLILGGMVWATIAANARARRDLAKLEQERGR